MRYIEWIPPKEFQVTKRENRITRFLKKAVIWLLSLIIPKANPDFGKEYDNVKNWWLEINDNGLAEREIGFDSSGKPIVIGPIRGNFGMVTDSPMLFDAKANVKTIEDNFQEIWNKFEDDFEWKLLNRKHK